MQKIMFNNKYGLEDLTFLKFKTMTRRHAPRWCTKTKDLTDEEKDILIKENSKFKIGEVVAIAQSYKDVLEEMIKAKGGYGEKEDEFFERYEDTPGWNNKLYVKANACIHHIRITDIKMERLQDISERDCLKEGIFRYGDPFNEGRVEDFAFIGSKVHYGTAREAFAALIDKVSGKGTWKANPWVFAYSFELVD